MEVVWRVEGKEWKEKVEGGVIEVKGEEGEEKELALADGDEGKVVVGDDSFAF